MKKPPGSKRETDFLHFERELHTRGIRLVAGVDEVGRGPLAGPVVAAAVILPEGTRLPGLKDSKKLTPKQRDRFFDEIRDVAIACGVGIVSHEEIDKTNILKASLKAMRIAVDELAVRPEHILIDGLYGIDHPLPQTAITGGDGKSHSIAASSVIAKVTRDRMMCEMEQLYPNFRFSAHKGYGTVRHYEELAKHGPTPIHRRSFLRKL